MAKKAQRRKSGIPGRKGKTSARASKAKHRGKPKPRQAVLPGHEQVRNARLDSFCEEIGEGREAMNKARTVVQFASDGAVQEMERQERSGNPVHIYKHAGVELVLVPGASKLRVRLTKDDGDASVEGGDTSDGNAGERGEGE